MTKFKALLTSIREAEQTALENKQYKKAALHRRREEIFRALKKDFGKKTAIELFDSLPTKLIITPMP
jgi:hypothetical protein